MIETVELVDHGRGLQLSTSRITVMDLVQYFRKGLSYEEIRFGIPSLSNDEIAVVEEYYRANQAELDAADDRVNARRDEAIRKQRERFPVIEETAEEARARFRKSLLTRRAENQDEGAPR